MSNECEEFRFIEEEGLYVAQKSKNTYSCIEKSLKSCDDFANGDTYMLGKLQDISTSGRKIRKDKRLSISKVLKEIIKRVDLCDYSVIQIINGEKTGISFESIGYHARVEYKTLRRVVRALKDSGYLEVFERYVNVGGSKKAIISSKKVDKSLFLHLGVRFETLEKEVYYAKTHAKLKSNRDTIEVNNHKLSLERFCSSFKGKNNYPKKVIGTNNLTYNSANHVTDILRKKFNC